MNVAYKNETKENVNIRGLIIAPGVTKISLVLIKDFDEAVEKDELSLFVDDGYRQVKVKPIKVEGTPAVTADTVKTEEKKTEVEPLVTEPPKTETVMPNPEKTEDTEKDEGVAVDKSVDNSPENTQSENTADNE